MSWKWSNGGMDVKWDGIVEQRHAEWGCEATSSSRGNLTSLILKKKNPEFLTQSLFWGNQNSDKFELIRTNSSDFEQIRTISSTNRRRIRTRFEQDSNKNLFVEEIVDLFPRITSISPRFHEHPPWKSFKKIESTSPTSKQITYFPDEIVNLLSNWN